MREDRPLPKPATKPQKICTNNAVDPLTHLLIDDAFPFKKTGYMLLPLDRERPKDPSKF